MQVADGAGILGCLKNGTEQANAEGTDVEIIHRHFLPGGFGRFFHVRAQVGSDDGQEGQRISFAVDQRRGFFDLMAELTQQLDRLCYALHTIGMHIFA